MSVAVVAVRVSPTALALARPAAAALLLGVLRVVRHRAQLRRLVSANSRSARILM